MAKTAVVKTSRNGSTRKDGTKVRAHQTTVHKRVADLTAGPPSCGAAKARAATPEPEIVEVEKPGNPLRDELYGTLGLDDGDFESVFIIGTQESARIEAGSAAMRVRGGGIGSDAWLARITGPNEQYGIEREFVDRNTNGLSGTGGSGTIRWDELPGDGIYEYRNWCASSRWPKSGFVAVRGGEVASLGNRKAKVQKATALLARGAHL